MRKWQDLAAPDDPGAYYDVSDMWGTGRGTYETADTYGSATTTAATGDGSAYSAWAFKTLSGSRAYLFDSGGKIFEVNTSSFAVTDRTGGITVAAGGMMTQYGDITILTRGTGNSLASSSGGNFSALAGSPSAEFVCVQSNAVVAFNSSTASDAWHASDIGDYTNWSTGEAANGRILENNGPITAAVPYGNDIIVFKSDSIFRMTYVGGVVKWQIQKVVHGVGCPPKATLTDFPCGGNYAVATNRGVFFMGQTVASGGVSWWLYDGSSPPVRLNPLTTIPAGFPTYDPVSDRAIVWQPYQVSGSVWRVKIRSYSFRDDLWGSQSEVTASGTNGAVPFRGDQSATFTGSESGTPLRVLIAATGGGGNLSYKLPVAPTSSSSCYLQTAKVGRADRKTFFDRLTPLLRRRTDLGTDSASLELTLFREREDTSAQTTRTISESSTRKRFDLSGGASTDNFARFKVTWTALDVEVDDFAISSKDAGTD